MKGGISQPVISEEAAQAVFAVWLRNIDSLGQLDEYAAALAAIHDGPSSVVAAYATPGPISGYVLAPQFFEDINIQDLRHQRLFKEWFVTQSTTSGYVEKRDVKQQSCSVKGAAAPLAEFL